MKRNVGRCAVICALTIFVCASLPCRVWADPPEALVLSYDAATQALTASVTHKSFFTGLHYIKRIEIKKNNQPVSENDYASQPDKTSFSYTYTIPATENDLLEVTAYCNIHGQKTATLKVESKKN